MPTQIVLNVPPGFTAGGRLDSYVTGFVLNATRAKVQKAIKEGNVSVNGRIETKPSYSVAAGDHIECTVMRPPPIRIDPEAIPLDIVHEDDDIIVVNKAAGMVVHPAFGHRSGTLVNALLHHIGASAIEADSEEKLEGLSVVNASLSEPSGARPGIVHRLDKDTSGLMVVAKNDVAHVRLSRQFEHRTIHRTYNALVWGNPDDVGEIEGPIGRSSRDRKKMAVVKGGKHALTRYRVLQRWRETSMLELQLETGRTHQIRVHLAHIGHHVLGDRTYGGDLIRSGPDTRNRRAYFRNLFELLPRQALHARTLELVHPSSGEEVRFDCDLPADMRQLIERLPKDVG